MLKESLAESVKKSELSGLVRYLGYVPKKDLPALYCGAEALLFPSLYEGFGLPVLEAMSCAVPVIASDASSVPEVAGNAAVYVRPDSIESIACAIRSVTSSKDLKASLREKGLERAKLFSARRMASDTLKLYRKVAST
jgi:glycosyltransferase involved in cell wall biosynthesis